MPAALDELASQEGVPWRAVEGWSIVAQRYLALAELYLQSGGRVEDLAGGELVFRGYEIGGWVRGQHRLWARLSPVQKAALTKVSLAPAGAGGDGEATGA